MTNRLNVFVFVSVIGCFVVAVVLGLFTETSSRAIGALLVACGLVAVACSHRLASAQDRLAESALIPSHWKNVRFRTFALWGVGVAILGLLQLFGF